MPRLLWKTLLFSLLAGILLTALWTPFRRAAADQQAAPAYQYVEPFLYAPFPGTASEESVFDHTSPNYSVTDNQIIAFTGDIANKTCPSPAPAGKAPPQAGVCDGGYGVYWSYSLGDFLAYNGHDGNDYGMQYRPLYAAADSDQVAYAGWYNPMDHKASLGIYVKLHHSNGYNTFYGHMSALALQSCAGPGCAALPHGKFIGYSGNTGNSMGPHLHFSVVSPAGKSIDPYGWTGAYTDPWPYNQRNSLWAQYPSVIPFSGATVTVLPSGAPLAYPATAASGILVDDSGPGFSEIPSGCWTSVATTGTQSQNGSMRYVKPIISGNATCMARWDLPAGQPAGEYAIFVRIPSVNAISEGALYNITHAGRTDPITVNQSVFPNPYFVSDGWLYVGEYNFFAVGNEYVSLPNRTADTADTYATRKLGADAVRFVYLSGDLPTITPGPTNTPSITPTPTASFTNTLTRTSTNTPVPSSTSTPTLTLTASQTRWPTITMTPSRTRSITPGPSPTRTTYMTDTRWPTKTRTPSRTATPTRTQTPSRTWTLTRTQTSSRTPTFTRTFTPTRTGTKTPGPSPTRRPFMTDTRWPTWTRTMSITPGPSPTRTPTRTLWPTVTRRPSDTRWPTVTRRPSDTRWPTRTPTP